MAVIALTPPARFVDPRGQRFGAAVSVGLLSLAFVADAAALVALVATLLAVSSAFGTRFFALSRPWPAIRRVLALGPAEPEHEYPPRFAQALGTTFLVLGLVTIALVGRPLGWLPVGAVVGLQALLAATGYCVGCRLYFLRWWLPSRFARIAARGDARATTVRLSMGPR
ncbi:MAG TPA: DUF4395 family protein [Candidatus Limnocylindrales bacterium]|nr:DUF4395 family protein [Candidatus Limnocylindrales bacterium]